ncbi:hypothetical protein [Vreelandella titanicae]|uniref:Uncharacterized protein n=1 Tax=Vreelandella titanicae TaxID=664683 RepID=A0A558J8G0_9GAMM|nr:hypothetical protein [Halomonas titanicae]TVU89916.1 hypothetical protein FQP89_11330 [Halomonas titanicae]
MADSQNTMHALTNSSLSWLCRSHAVEQHAILSEIKTLVIIANYACDFLTEGLQALPEDFFTCIEEMKEVMESIDLKSLDFEKRVITLKRTKRRLEAKASLHNRNKEIPE